MEVTWKLTLYLTGALLESSWLSNTICENTEKTFVTPAEMLKETLVNYIQFRSVSTLHVKAPRYTI